MDCSARCVPCPARRHLNILLNLLGVVVGLGLGFGLRALQADYFSLFWVGLAGRLYIRFLTMMIIPLAVSSLISGVATLDLKSGRRFGLVLLPLVFFNNFISTSTALVFSHLAFRTDNNATDAHLNKQGDYSAIFATLLRNMVPQNMLRTNIQKLTYILPDGQLNNSFIEYDHNMEYPEQYVDGPNMIGIIVVSLIFGVTAGLNKSKTRPFINFFAAISTLCLRILSGLSWIQPLSTISLTAAAIGGLVNLKEIFTHLGLFLGVMAGAIALHQFVVLPVFILIATRRNPFSMFYYGRRAWALVFATTSSVLAVPEMFAAGEALGVELAEAEVGIPLALLTNTSGAGIYVCTATVLLAYLQGIQFSMSRLLILGIFSLTTVMSIDVVSNGALGGLLLITTSLGLPTSNVGLLIAVEWIADRLRATCNTMSTLTCVYSAHRFTKSLKRRGSVLEITKPPPTP